MFLAVYDGDVTQTQANKFKLSTMRIKNLNCFCYLRLWSKTDLKTANSTVTSASMTSKVKDKSFVVAANRRANKRVTVLNVNKHFVYILNIYICKI